MRPNYGGAKRIKLEGTTKGYWEIDSYVGDGKYLCQCVCGVTRLIDGSNLHKGDTRSCGCMAAELRNARESRPQKPLKIEKYE